MFWNISVSPKVSRVTVTPLDPGQPVDFHPHAKAIEKLNSQLDNAALPVEEPESIKAKIAAFLRDGDPLPPNLTTRYMQTVGALQHLATASRPDIAYATGMLAGLMSKPSSDLLKSAERLLRYVFSTLNYGLVLDGSKESSLITVIGYADSNFVANKHSTTCNVLCLHGQPIH
jgi:hypothetical protein